MQSGVGGETVSRTSLQGALSTPEKPSHSPSGSVTGLNCNSEQRSERRLRLEVIDSIVLAKGTELVFTAKGLEGSLRAGSDGTAYIGNGRGNNVAIDYCVPEDSPLMGSRHFLVTHTNGRFFARDLGEGTGTFYRVQGSYPLSSGAVVSFSEVHLLITIAGNTLQVKVISGPKSGEEFAYEPSASPVLIGRTSSCALTFSDNCLSRYQCSFVYDAKTGWVLFDGLNTCKPSTNGTWLLMKGLTEIADGVIFKAGSTHFRASIV